MKKVKIYCWTHCPYCIKAKQLLKQKGVPYDEIVIDGDEEALRKLKAQTGSGSVPQIFVDDIFIGGCDDMHQLDEIGKFEEVFT